MLSTSAIFKTKQSNIELQPSTIEAIYEMDGDTFEHFCDTLMAEHIFISDLKDYMYVDSAGVIHGLLALNIESGDGILIDARGCDYARYTAFMPNIKEYVDRQISLTAEQIVKDATQMSDKCDYAFDCESAEKYYGLPVTDDNGIGAILLRGLQEREEFSDIEIEDDVFYLKLKDEFKIEQTSTEPTMQM